MNDYGEYEVIIDNRVVQRRFGNSSSEVLSYVEKYSRLYHKAVKRYLETHNSYPAIIVRKKRDPDVSKK